MIAGRADTLENRAPDQISQAGFFGVLLSDYDAEPTVRQIVCDRPA